MKQSAWIFGVFLNEYFLKFYLVYSTLTNQVDTLYIDYIYIVSGDAALSSGGKSNDGSNCMSLTAWVRFDRSVTTLRRTSSLTEVSKW